MMRVCCDLLKNQYLCVVRHNSTSSSRLTIQVVICLKISIFAQSDTTWKLCPDEYSSCDLLKNQYLCVVRHNKRLSESSPVVVVICLKISIFAQSDTTYRYCKPALNCCDLLKNQYLCVVRHNLLRMQLSMEFVVICLKISIFAQSDTTVYSYRTKTVTL